MWTKRLFLLTFFCMMLGLPAVWAQQSSMTDKQVTEFILKENEKGTSQQEIIKKLIERGVPVDQIQRIRRKYEREKKQSQLGARDISGMESGRNRLRENNGELKEDGSKALGYRRSTQKVDKAKISERRRRMMREDEEQEYADGMDFFFPDTLALYDNLLGEEEEKGPRVFGRNIFNRKDLTFEPEMNIATPEDYRLGPGDAVFVDVWGTSNKSFTATISPMGTLSLRGSVLWR